MWLHYVQYLLSQTSLSVLCNIYVPYSAGWNFPQSFYVILCLSHLLTSVLNFTEIVSGEPLHRGLNVRGVAKYSDFGPVKGYTFSEMVQDMIILVQSNGTTLDPLGWPLIRVLGQQFSDIIYISEVNEARKVKSDAQVAMNKNSDPVQKFFLVDCWGQCPKLVFIFCSMCRMSS